MGKKYSKDSIDLALRLSDEEVQDIVTLHEQFKDIRAELKSAIAAKDKAIEYANGVSRVINSRIREITESKYS